MRMQVSLDPSLAAPAESNQKVENKSWGIWLYKVEINDTLVDSVGRYGLS